MPFCDADSGTLKGGGIISIVPFFPSQYGNNVKGKFQEATKLPSLSPEHLSVDKWKDTAAKITVNE